MPLNQPSFLADMDLLTRSDESNDDAPLRDSFGELDKVLGLGLVIRAVSVRFADLFGIKRTLRFVEDQDVFRRYRSARR